MEWIKYYSAFVFALVVLRTSANTAKGEKFEACVVSCVFLAPVAFYIWGQ